MRRLTLFALAVAAVGCTTTNDTVAPPTAIDPPVNLRYQLVPSGDPTLPVGILLRWDPSPDGRVVAYQVYSRSAAGIAWGLRATTTSPSFYDLGAPDYQYQVTAIDVNGLESVGTNLVTVDASNQPPAPNGLTPISLNTAIQLSWLPNARTAAFEYYRVYSTSYNIATRLCDTNWFLEGTTVSEDFISSGLANGVSLCFAVSAVSTDGHESDWSVPTYDTPRYDARNVLINAFQLTPATSGFLFYDAATAAYGLVTSGARTDLDFRVDRHADGSLWLLPIWSGTSVQDLGAKPDLTSIDIAPAAGYGVAAVPAVVGHAYAFKMSDVSGDYYGGLRVTALAAGYAIVDWSYQSAANNPELLRRRP